MKGDNMAINLNDLAREVTLEEGLKKSISIAQVKEVMKIVFKKLAGHEEETVLKVLRRYRRKKV